MARKKATDTLKDAPQLGSSHVISLPQPPLRNAEEYLRAYIGYVYTAVGSIAQEVASIDLHLYKATFTNKGVKTQEVFEHPALSVLHYSNELYTLYDMIEATQTYLELTGEAFWVAVGGVNGQPRELWPLRPDWVKVIPSPTNVIDHYNYYAGGVMSEKVEIPREHVIPFKYFNPLNPYRGKGPTQAAALPFDILNFAGEYNRNFFFNSAIPSMVFTTDQKISETAVKRFLAQWQGNFGGRTKSNKVAFLGNGMKLDRASMGAKELDFTEQMKMMRDDVLAVFKVPKTVLGLTEDVNRANANATTRAFMERVITPRMRKFVDTLNEFYLPMFVGDDNTYFLDFTDPAPEDVEMKLKRYQSGRTYNWLTPNEIRMEENLDPIEGGDDLFATGYSVPTPTAEDDDEGEDVNEPVDDEPTKPTGDDEKGIRASIIRLLGGTIKKGTAPYTPPAHLKARPVKHMVKLPVKRIKKLEQEQLAAKFVEPLKQFISELVAKDSYAPLKKKAGKDETLDDVLKKAMEEVREKDALVKAEKEKQEARVQRAIREGSSWDEEQKVAYWKAFISKVEGREDEVKKISQEVFEKQEALVMEKLESQFKAWRKLMGRKANVADTLPDLEVLNSTWGSLEKTLRDIFIEQGNYTLEFLGVGGEINITTEFASWYLNEYSGLLIKGIDETTLKALRDTLTDGFDAGEGVDKLGERIQEVFDDADTRRAEAIAQSEVTRASNTASVEAYRQSGVVSAKEWLIERDGKTCAFCLKLDGKAIGLNTNFFKKGETYTVEDEEGNKQSIVLDYVAVGEPPLHTRCRCTVIPVIITTDEE